MPPQDTQWKPGQSGNPAGRPKGARSRLSEKLIARLEAHFDQTGDELIAAACIDSPSTVLMISLVPKQQAEKVNPFDELTDAELEQLERWIEATRRTDPVPATNLREEPHL
jgi:Family of unknown function (DUF5681)